MKKMIAVFIILIIGLTVTISGCDTEEDSEIPQPPTLPEDQANSQPAGNQIPQPPALPEV